MFAKGDVVSFGRPNGEKTEGIVVKVNTKTVIIETTEARGMMRVREAGKKWRVPNDSRFVTMITPAANRPVQPVAAVPQNEENWNRHRFSGDAWFDRWFSR